MTRIQGDGITLRPWTIDDVAGLVDVANDPAIARTMPDAFPSPYTEADARDYLALSQTADSPGRHFAIEVGGALIGGAGFTPKKDVYRLTAELGYWLGRAQWGKGYATAALGLLTDHIFATTELERLEGRVFERNAASARVLEKCGYRLESRAARAVIKNNEILDALLYVRLRER